MSIVQAEELKSRFTDKYVVVQDGVPELRRFSGLTGTVKTVNMNCRALVQFDGPADIAWYDIDPSYLKIVDAPVPKKKAEGHAPKAEAAAKPAVAKPAVAMPAGGAKSPLELARAQAAAKAAGGAVPASAPAAAPAGEKKLSPLELARQQGAAKAKPAGDKPVEAAAAPAAVASASAEPAPAAAPKAAGAAPAKPGSTAEILALARQQGAVNK